MQKWVCWWWPVSKYFFQKSNTIFCSTLFFTFQAQSLFKHTAFSLSFLILTCTVGHSKQAAIVFIPAVSVLPSSKRSVIIFLIHFFYSLLYIKPLVAINKQFRIDSFLHWEGHHWDFCSPSVQLRTLLSIRSCQSKKKLFDIFCPNLERIVFLSKKFYFRQPFGAFWVAKKNFSTCCKTDHSRNLDFLALNFTRLFFLHHTLFDGLTKITWTCFFK